MKTRFQRGERWTCLWLAALLILGLAVRWMFLQAPPLDFHATRQLRGVLVARGLYYQLQPNPDPVRQALAAEFLGSIERFEPPLLENLVAHTYLLLGEEAPWVARIFTTLAWVMGAAWIFVLVSQPSRMPATDDPGSSSKSSRVTAWVVTGIYLFLPFGVVASRSFQPDPWMVAALVGTAWSLSRWQARPGWAWALAAGILAGFAGLLKPFALLPALGMMLAAVLSLGVPGSSWFRVFRNGQAWAMGLLAILPGAIYYFSGDSGAGDYFTNWTLNVFHLVLRPSFPIQWLLQIDEVIGVGTFFLALLGVVVSPSQRKWILLGWWGGYGLTGLLLPYLITTHNYYSLALVPLAALSLASLVELAVTRVRDQGWIWQLGGIGIAVIALGFAIWQARNWMEKGNQPALVQTWQAAAEAVPPASSVIALTQYYGYPLMVYGWQKVSLWPTTGEQQLSALRGQEIDPIQDLFSELTQGKTHFLVTDFEQLAKQPALAEILSSRYPLVAQGEGYLLYDLQTAP